MSNATTIVPACYPALEAEVYLSLDDASERETVLPPAGRDPVEVEVDAMFWDNEGERIALADLREGLAFRLSQRSE